MSLILAILNDPQSLINVSFFIMLIALIAMVRRILKLSDLLNQRLIDFKCQTYLVEHLPDRRKRDKEAPTT